jgi:heme/copper-type cytochrome/quinol oxidase subunit 3
MRPTLAVVLGFALWSALWLGSDQVFRSLWPAAYPEDPTTPVTAVLPLLAYLVASVVCSLAAGFSARKTAGSSSRAVLVLALILLAVGIAVQASAWTTMPLWYHLPFLILLVPVCLAGGGLAGAPGR